MFGTVNGGFEPTVTPHYMAISHPAERSPAQGSVALEKDSTENVMPIDGEFNRLHIKAIGMVSSSEATITLVKNGTDTSLTLAMNTSNTEDTNFDDSVTFNAGDHLNFKVDTTDITTAFRLNGSMIFSGGQKQAMILGGDSPDGGDTIGGNSTPQNYPLLSKVGGSDESLVDEKETTQIMPLNGTLKNMYVRLNKAPNVGQTLTFTLRKNESNTNLNVPITSASSLGSNLSDSVKVVAGDLLNVRLTKAGGNPPNATTMSFGFEFEPDEHGLFPIFMMRHVFNSTTDLRYYPPFCSNNASSSSPSQEMVTGNGTFINKMYVNLDLAPGSGKSWTFTLVRNDTDTSVAATIANDSESGSDLSNFSESASFDGIQLKVDPDGAPSTSNFFRVSAVGRVGGEPIIFHSRV